MIRLLVGALILVCAGHAAAGSRAPETKRTIQQLTSIFENSTTEFQYTFCENIGDQRGWTFGFVGFTSGTYSGNMFLKEYRALRPDNPLVRFIPIFDRIDRGPHDSEGRNPDTRGLTNFRAVFQSCGGDPAFRRAQHRLADRLSWQPALRLSRALGVRPPLTRGQLYDAYVNHGESGIRRLLARARGRAGGTPATGVPETRWLRTFLQVRLAVLKADPVWARAVDRIAVYQRLLDAGNLTLRRPFEVDCYGNHFVLE